MTTTLGEQIEQIDLSDLDLLDNSKAHGWCEDCYPLHKIPMSQWPTVIEALCGERMLIDMIPSVGPGQDPRQPPEGACEECVRVTVCRRCGSGA